MGETERGDFLKQDASTPLGASYRAAGLRLRVETNADSVLQMARQNFEEADSDAPEGGDDIRLRLWVEETPEGGPAPPRPYFRGLGDMVFCGFDEGSSLAINLRDRSGAGRLTAALARDPGFWKTILFPSFLTIVGPVTGLTSLHCACVAWQGNGLLLAGESGAGKSCLSLALAQAGFDFLADDRTLIGGRRGQLTAWGLSAEMKQRAEAAAYFPGLKAIEARPAWGREPVFRFDPVQRFGVSRVAHCQPRWIFFLERRPESLFSLRPIAPAEAARRLRRDLHRQSAAIARRQQRTIDALLQTECRSLRYGGDPHVVAEILRRSIARGLQSTATFFASPRPAAPDRTAPADPLRRFQATPLSADVSLMGRIVQIETNDPGVLQYVTTVFPGAHSNGPPQFLWRIVCDRREAADAVWPRRNGFSDRAGRYVNLGQQGFIAVDLEAREAVGRLPERLAQDQDGFASVFLASLLHLSAPALGLTAVSAAGVAADQDGLLLFGPAKSGKTSSGYQASRTGLEFFADQAVFLEMEAGQVYAWGDFWPAAFRPETARFLPELSRTGRAFTYRDRTFLCLDKSPGTTPARRVTPAACIFLDRNAAATPHLIPLSGEELSAQVLTEAGGREERAAALALLRRVPAYRLAYGEDPGDAARCFPGILTAHRLVEERT